MKFFAVKRTLLILFAIAISSVMSFGQTFEDGTEGLTKKKEIKAARKAHNCKLIGDMHEAAKIYLNRKRDEQLGVVNKDADTWLATAMRDMFAYSGAYPMQFMYCGCAIDMKMMQDASTELLVEWRMKGAPYDSIRAIESWRNYFYQVR
jgi:hypothetical protein